MPPESAYSLQDLVDLGGVTPRTIRYYIVQGLLPSPGKAGPGTTYTDGHLNRLRLIRRLQREHLPLAEIRSRLAALDDATVAALVEAPASEPPADSAIDYIRAVLEGDRSPEGMPWNSPSDMTPPSSPAAPPASPPPSTNAVDHRVLAYRLAEPSQAYAEPPAPTPAPDRSQWDRILLAPDVELHVRRPLGRRAHKRVERLIEIARELLEEDQP
jgi:DNA-binding transcriptional MerR regulator